MKAAALVSLVALALVPATASAAAPPMLGIDWSVPGQRLAWFDPRTLRTLPGPKAPLDFHVGSWSFSADRSVLAIGGNGVTLRFVDARRMRLLGDLQLALGGDSIGGVTWLRPDRLLAFVRRPGDTALVVVDPATRRVLESVDLRGRVAATARLADGLVLLLEPEEGIGAARLAVSDADGHVRTTTLKRIEVGSRRDAGGGEIFHDRSAGLAVDPVGRRAYVIGADASVQVDLDTLDVVYRSSPRALAKAIDGPARTARWLGGGLVAIAGADYRTVRDKSGISTTETPFGLRLLDVRTWTTRVVDPADAWFDLADGLLIAQHEDTAGAEAVAYGRDGAERFRISLPSGTWLNTAGATGLVCSQRDLVAVVDLATGKQTRAKSGRICPDLLTGRSSGY